jgi:hypothetical protein
MKKKYKLEKTNRNIKHYYFKNEDKIVPILDNIKKLFILSISLIIFVFILKPIGVISIKEGFLIEINSIEYKEIYKDLVIAQISITFLITSILSLIDSMENKRIFGEKATKLLFGKKGYKFYASVFILYATMISNIVLVIKEKFANILIIFFSYPCIC